MRLSLFVVASGATMALAATTTSPKASATLTTPGDTGPSTRKTTTTTTTTTPKASVTLTTPGDTGPSTRKTTTTTSKNSVTLTTPGATGPTTLRTTTTKTTTKKTTTSTTTTTTSACPTNAFKLQLATGPYAGRYIQSNRFPQQTEQFARYITNDINQATGYTLVDGEAIGPQGEIWNAYTDVSYAYLESNRTKIAEEGKVVMKCALEPPKNPPAAGTGADLGFFDCVVPNDSHYWVTCYEVDNVLMLISTPGDSSCPDVKLRALRC